MKYRMISTCDVPLSVPFPGGDVLLKRRDDSAEVDISAAKAELIARPGAVRFERVEEPAAAVDVPTKSVETKTTARGKAAAQEAPAAEPATKSEETEK